MPTTPTKITTVAQATKAGAYDATNGAGSYAKTSGATPASTSPTSLVPIPANNGTDPHDAPSYNPRTDPTSSVYDKNYVAPTESPTQPLSGTPTPNQATTGEIMPDAQGNFSEEQGLQNLKNLGYTSPDEGEIQGSIQDLKSKYTKAHATAVAGGAQAPVDSGSGSAGVAKVLGAQPESYTPSPENQVATNDITSTYAKAVADFIKPDTQRKSLVEEYQSMSKALGIPELKAELLDTNRIMNGSEDDIRSEITAAGGFATNSQVGAMTIARNKSLLQKAQYIQDQLTSAKDELGTLTSLSAKDREYADQHATTSIGLLGKMVDLQQTMKKAATDNYNNIVKEVGYDGLMKMTGNDPYNIGLVEKSLGFAPGGLQQVAQSAAQKTAQENTKSNLQNDLLRSQIYKNYKDSSSVAALTDPAELVAYAQQYASNGQIPTGLPNGSFGVISQYAKEIPKTPGTLVDKNTGVVPSATNLSGDKKDALVSLYNAIQKTDDLKAQFNKTIPGFVGGTFGKVFGSNAQYDYLSAKDLVTKELQYALSGKAITQQEYDYFDGLLPGRFSNSFFLGVPGEQKIDDFKKNVSDTLNNKLNSYGTSIYGYSKVKTPAGDFTVGDVVDIGGNQYRVLSDGQLSTLTQ